MSKDYSEDQLIQKSAADLLENELGWTGVMAWDAEVLGETGTLGSLGIFSLVRLVRPAQYLISAADFVIPDKECVSGGPDNPCDLFRSMAFPVAEFSPAPMPLPVADRNKCGCNG